MSARYTRQHWRGVAAVTVGVVLAFILSACGGGGSSSSPSTPPTAVDCSLPSNQTTSQCGATTFSITDAAGDFVSYDVTIDQITLTRTDGLVVKALAAPVSVDLTDLIDVNQLLASAYLPSGTYNAVAIQVDYTNADIAALDSQDKIVNLTPVDGQGQPAGIQTVQLKLSNDAALVIQQGVSLLASLDFDLEASNNIDFSASPPTVTVSPYLYAAATTGDLPATRATGELANTDLTAGTYTINLAPLYTANPKSLGSLVVAVSNQTTYDIDGATYVGSAGLQALAQLAAGTMTLAYGTYTPQDGQFEANQVYAGTSIAGVPDTSLDSVHGSVIARTGDTLTVLGKTFVQTNSTTLYHSTVTVNLGSKTVVRQAGDLSTQLGLTAISVGQRVVILGTLTDTTPTSLVMDAGIVDTGYVRLEPSVASGNVLALNAGEILMNLVELNHHPAAWFNFSGTGITSSNDALPSNYEINTGALSQSGLTVDEPAEVTGFVQPFGQAPPDFNAVEIGNYVQSRARLLLNWQPTGTTAPFTTEDATQLVVNLSAVRVAHIRQGGVMTPLVASAAPLTIVPPSGNGIFALRQGGTVTVYVSFANFVKDLQSRLDGSTAVGMITGRGGYDSANKIFTATRLAVSIK